ncbi:MAG: DUF4007 family protein [Gammaproteobacteria bacterium]
MRGPLFHKDYRPQFSGHETFPLRYGWLKKVYDRVAETEDQPENRTACWDDDAIARFGVGKNMVAAMRHWANATQIIEEPTANTAQAKELGKKLFHPRGGLDQYMENPATLWLIHWQLVAREEKTTWFWAFSHYPAITFERDKFEKLLERFVGERGWKVASKTIKNDAACFIRTYVARQPSRKAGLDDALESPLTELGLIKAIGKKDGFRFVRGPKPTLGDGVFTYALIDFWSRHAPNAATLSFESVAHSPGGPGRVFLLDENDVVDRLSALDSLTGGAFRWSETAGLKQVVRNVDINEETALKWIPNDYDAVAEKEVA